MSQLWTKKNSVGPNITQIVTTSKHTHTYTNVHIRKYEVKWSSEMKWNDQFARTVATLNQGDVINPHPSINELLMSEYISTKCMTE